MMMYNKILNTPINNKNLKNNINKNIIIPILLNEWDFYQVTNKFLKNKLKLLIKLLYLYIDYIDLIIKYYFYLNFVEICIK